MRDYVRGLSNTQKQNETNREQRKTCNSNKKQPPLAFHLGESKWERVPNWPNEKREKEREKAQADDGKNVYASLFMHTAQVVRTTEMRTSEWLRKNDAFSACQPLRTRNTQKRLMLFLLLSSFGRSFGGSCNAKLIHAILHDRVMCVLQMTI